MNYREKRRDTAGRVARTLACSSDEPVLLYNACSLAIVTERLGNAGTVSSVMEDPLSCLVYMPFTGRARMCKDLVAERFKAMLWKRLDEAKQQELNSQCIFTVVLTRCQLICLLSLRLLLHCLVLAQVISLFLP